MQLHQSYPVIEGEEGFQEFLRGDEPCAELATIVLFSGIIPENKHLIIPPETGFVSAGSGKEIVFDSAPVNDPSWRIFYGFEPGDIWGMWNGARGVRPEWWGAKSGLNKTRSELEGNSDAFDCAVTSGYHPGQGAEPVNIILDSLYYEVSRTIMPYVPHARVKAFPFKLIGRGADQTFIYGKGISDCLVEMGGDPTQIWRNSFGFGIEGVTLKADGKIGLKFTSAIGEQSIFRDLRVSQYGSRGIDAGINLINNGSFRDIVIDQWVPTGTPEQDIAFDLRGGCTSVYNMTINASSSNKIMDTLVRLQGKNTKLSSLHLENGKVGIAIRGSGVYSVDNVDFREGENLMSVESDSAFVYARSLVRERKNTKGMVVDSSLPGGLAAGSIVGTNWYMTNSYMRRRDGGKTVIAELR